MPFYPVSSGAFWAQRPTANYNGRKIARALSGQLWCCYARPLVNIKVYAAHSEDDGLTWTEEIVFAGPGPNIWSPAIAVDTLGQVHIVYDNGKGIEYSMRDLSGAWSVPVSLEFPPTDEPSLAIDSHNQLHVVCSMVSLGTRNIRYFTNPGGVWVGEWVTTVATQQRYSAIAVDSSDNLHVVWTGLGWGVNPGNWNIQYRERTGAGWGPQIGLTDEVLDQTSPQICVDINDWLHALWTGDNARYRLNNGVWGAIEDILDIGDGTIALENTTPVIVGHDLGTFTQMMVSKRSPGWLVAVQISNPANSHDIPVLFYARFPNNNIPLTGYCFVCSVDDSSGLEKVWFFKDNLSFVAPPPPPPPITNATVVTLPATGIG